MDLNPGTEQRATLAADLADRFSSRLIGIAAQAILAPMYFEAPVPGIPSILEIEERSARENIATAEKTFRKIAGSRNQVEWRQAVRFPLDYALEQARAADLIVAARPRHGEHAPELMSVDGGDLVMDAGRPVLFVPPHVDHLLAKRVVVGWKDTRESRRAVWDALPMLKTAEEVVVASIEVDSEGGKDVVRFLGSHGVNDAILSRPKPNGSVGDELLRIAEAELADLIVCGAYGHSRTQEWVFGGVTRELLDHCPVCCLMAH